jgi:uncharacterized membrane protein
MPTCSGCGSDVNEGLKFCPKCGQPQAAAASSSSSSSSPGGNGGGYAGASTAAPGGATSAAVENQNVMGAVAYVTIIPAIIFLVIEPYNKNRFVRFHSFQCLFLALAAFALSIANMILSLVLGFIPVVGWIIGLVLGFGIPIAIFAVWVIAVLKAYQGEEYRLPIIGDLAAKQV